MASAILLRMGRKALAWAVAALAVFHAWLLAGQVWDGTLVAEPGLLWRWAVAAVLVVGLEGLRRRGASLIRGRQSLTIWLVAALLHGPAVSDRANVDRYVRHYELYRELYDRLRPLYPRLAAS